MTAEIDRPILLRYFPVALEVFYVQPDSDDPRVTESVNPLMPGEEGRRGQYANMGPWCIYFRIQARGYRPRRLFLVR